MLYSEFIEGTGCKDNEKNYKVYKDLEVMYMNSDMSKAEIYEYGKKLVDNSKSEAELKIEAEIKAEIAGYKEQIENNKKSLEYHIFWAKTYKEEKDNKEAKYHRHLVKVYKEENRKLRDMIRFLKIA